MKPIIEPYLDLEYKFKYMSLNNFEIQSIEINVYDSLP